MKTVLNVKTDKEVKEQAQELAEEIGVPLSTVVNAYLKEFIRTREVRFVAEPHARPEVIRALKQALRGRKAGKNTSGRLTTEKQMLDFLHQ